MPNAAPSEKTLAVLIDAENASPSVVGPLMTEVAKLGVASVKRIYGDWTTPLLAGWKERLLAHSIQPIQQFRYTIGKNATDSSMIIDAMDLLYTGRFGGFCLVTSDSDFTRLASRIRESGIVVYGFGEQKTPKAFVAACDRFIYTEVLQPPAEDQKADGRPRKRTAKELKSDARLMKLINSAVDGTSDDTGWTDLGRVGGHMSSQSPDFDPRNYGYGKLSELVTAMGIFTIDRSSNLLRIKKGRPKKRAAV